MKLSIRHTTRYAFSQPVTHALQRLRLTPKATQGQEILEWQMGYENAHPELQYDDEHFNTVTLVAVEPDAREVAVTCTGIVETRDNAGVIGQHSGHLPLWSFLCQTPLTKAGPAVRALIRELPPPPADEARLDYLHALSALIRERVEYETGTSDAGTSAEEAAGEGKGVCQDHAHIFLSAARAVNIPARYVSGYLMMDDRIDQDASHAWVEAYTDDLGWVGFDVSNQISPDERYVRLATGLDYAEAAPTSGLVYGGGSESMIVSIQVQQ